MNKYIILTMLTFLLFSGCVQLKTKEDCMNLNPDKVISQTSYGENILHFDETVIMKANITCWHTAALGYVAKNDPDNAIYCCEQIKQVSSEPSDADMLYREYVLCIDAVATRLKDPDFCYKISNEKFGVQQKSCIRHATKPPDICSGTLLILLVLGSSLFLLKKN